MILIDTPYDKVMEVMEAEWEKVDFAMSKEASKAEKKFYRTHSFPFIHHNIYTVPSSGNKYLLWFYVEKSQSPIINPRLGTALMVYDREGKRNYYVMRPIERLNTRTLESEDMYVFYHYTAHFMSRYRERMGYPENMQPLDLAVTFFGRNDKNNARSQKEKINGRSDGQNEYRSTIIRDGVTLTCYLELKAPDGKKVEFHRHNTFLTEEMLKQSQRKDFFHVPNAETDLVRQAADIMKRIREEKTFHLDYL